jgi:hypothetical protein
VFDLPWIPPRKTGLQPRFSILAHQLRRRFPPNRFLFRGADRSTDCAARRFAGLSIFRPVFSEPKFLRAKTTQCSAALLGSTTLRVPLHSPHRSATSRVALEEDRLFRRLFPAGPVRTRGSSHSCRRRSDLWSPTASCPRFRFLERPGSPSRSPAHNAQLFRVAKAKFSASMLWITGISGKIGGTFRNCPDSSRIGCRSVLLRLLPTSA